MNRYRYQKLDAFASQNSSGNPAACLYLEDAQRLSHEQMLSIAKQHKGFVSEVAFCRQTGENEFELAYYSSECEVDFCGHATIACMYSLISKDETLRAMPALCISTKKGVLTVYNEIEKQDAVFIAAPAPVYKPFGSDVQSIAQALGTDAAVLSQKYPVSLVNAGLDTLIVPVRSLDELIGIFPSEQQLKAYCAENGADIVLIFSEQTQSAAHQYHTRVFAPKFGYLEDPATGSGNSAFGCYLKKQGLWDGADMCIEQGAVPGAYNTVKLRCNEEGAVLFGGGAVKRIEGTYYL